MRGIRWSAAVVAAGLWMLAAPVAGAQRPTPAAETIEATLRDGSVSTDSGPRTLRQVYDGFDMDDPKAAVDAVRALVERRWRTSLPDSRAAAAAGPDRKSLRDALPAGDIDADGKDDVLLMETSFEDFLSDQYTFELAALSGVDGAEMWRREVTAFDAMPLFPGDVTGDGRGDLVLLHYSRFYEPVEYCSTSLCAGVRPSTYTWTLDVVSGADGSSVWTRSLDGATGTAFAGVNLFPPGLISNNGASVATNVGVLPLLAGDHDGDGRRDIVLNAFDVAGPSEYQYLAPGASTSAVEFRQRLVQTHATVLSGSEGAVLLSREQNLPTSEGALLESPGDVVGGDGDDLLWQASVDVRPTAGCNETPAVYSCFGVERIIVDLEAIDGASLAIGWTRRLQDDRAVTSFVEPAGDDLNGDGRDDLMHWYEIDYGSGSSGWFLDGLAGSNGARLWRREAQAFPASIDGVILGPAGGQPGKDFLLLDIEIRPDAGGMEVLIYRVDGGTGRNLTFTRRVYDNDERSFRFGVGPDSDGDPVRDIVIGSVKSVYTVSPAQHTTTATVESGATGSTVFSRVTDGDIAIFPGGDLNGDGRGDLYGFTSTIGTAPFTAAAIAVPSGEFLWTRGGEAVNFEIGEAGATGGAAGTDLMSVRTQGPYTNYRSRVDVIDGADGSRRWAVGDAMGAEGTPSLTLTGAATGDRLSGRVGATGFCRTSRVELLRGESESPVATTMPDEFGRWTVLLSGTGGGTFHARVPADGECAEARSGPMVIDADARADAGARRPSRRPTRRPSRRPSRRRSRRRSRRPGPPLTSEPTPDPIPGPPLTAESTPDPGTRAADPAPTPGAPASVPDRGVTPSGTPTLGRTARLRGSRLHLRVRCKSGQNRCRGRLDAFTRSEGRRKRIASGRLSLASGRSSVLRLVMRKSARRSAKKARRIELRVRLADGRIVRRSVGLRRR